jgi:DNA-binding NarL/FixJ family response regulator
MQISIALVEDNPSLTQVISETLGLFDELKLVFTASNGRDALQKLEGLRELPQVILMDIEMPVMDGIRTTAELTKKYPEIKVVMLSVFDQDDKIFQSILAGATGYLLKDEKPGRLMQAIEDAITGGAPMSAQIAGRALQMLRKNMSPVLPGAEEVSMPRSGVDLTRREWEILEDLSNGLSYQQIADKLVISPKTVRKHIENIYEKLRVHNKVEATQLAIKNRWFQ